MISSVQDFGDATSFERWALEGLVPLPAARPHTAVKDIAGNEVRITVGTAVVRAYAGGVQEVYVDLRPLAFGAAWKVLDLLVELALTQAGITAAGGSVTITEKVKQAKAAAGLCPPLSSNGPVWGTLTATYAATEQIRHSLVHRQAEVDRATGELTGHDRNGQPLAPLPAAGQEAFCRAVQRAAKAVLTGSISSRERSDLAWNLDQLQGLHQQPTLGGVELGPVPLGLAPAPAPMQGPMVVIDAPTMITALIGNFPGRAGYDASYQLPDGRHLLVELEQAPATVTALDLTALPTWATFWAGPA